MKKFILLLTTIFAVSINSYAESGTKCLLHHQGKVTVYDGASIDAAIKASADGDTIFLGEGSYPGFTITKKITVRGAGQDTKITGGVKISLKENSVLSQTIMEWLNLGSNNITVQTLAKNIKIKQCFFNSMTTSVNNIEDVLVDRCYINGNISGFKSANIVNSKVNNVNNGSNTYDYLNCNIYYLYNSSSVNCTNCIIRNSNSSYIQNDNSIFKNCLLYNQFDLPRSSIQKDCWRVPSFSMTTDLTCSYGKYDLENKGYIGTDGLVVGVEGGTAPFSLEPSVPKVTSSTVAYDPDSKQLKVNLTVTTNKE